MVLLIDVLIILTLIGLSISLYTAKKSFLPSWLKGGLIGIAILWPIGYIFSVLITNLDICSKTYYIHNLYQEETITKNKCGDLLFQTMDFIPLPNLLGWLFCLGIGFLIGALIGLIIGKLKSSRKT